MARLSDRPSGGSRRKPERPTHPRFASTTRFWNGCATRYTPAAHFACRIVVRQPRQMTRMNAEPLGKRLHLEGDLHLEQGLPVMGPHFYPHVKARAVRHGI